MRACVGATQGNEKAFNYNNLSSGLCYMNKLPLFWTHPKRTSPPSTAAQLARRRAPIRTAVYIGGKNAEHCTPVTVKHVLPVGLVVNNQFSCSVMSTVSSSTAKRCLMCDGSCCFLSISTDSITHAFYKGPFLCTHHNIMTLFASCWWRQPVCRAYCSVSPPRLLVSCFFTRAFRSVSSGRQPPVRWNMNASL